MDPLIIVVAVLGFVTVGGLGFVFTSGGNSQSKAIKRVQNIGGPIASKRARADNAKMAANDPNARRKQIVKSLKDQEKQARKATVTMSARLQQAGLSLGIRTFWIISGVLGVLAFAPFVLFGLNPLIGLGASFAAGLGLPRWVVGFLAKRRTKKFTIAFSDAIDIIVRGIRSGLPVHDCLKIIARECPEPVASEFQRLNENIAMGMTMEQALEKMFERMPTPELRFFAIVMAIQAKTGGNLGEALANLSAVLRGRRLMREKIKAMSSEAVASSFIIGSLPPGVVILISITSPQYMGLMYSTSTGHMMLGGSALWMGLGIVIMRNMINFKF
jgi:tight adherence protein B